MKDNFRYTPAEHMQVVNPDLKKAIDYAFKNRDAATNYMRKNAATLLEEMTLDDMVDWAYKSVHPIVTPENQEKHEYLFVRDAKIAKLPIQFQKITSVEFSAIGDLIYSDILENSKNRLFENIHDLIFKADISYANFESPITKQELIKEIISDAAAPIECCNEELFDILAQHNGKYFDILNTANNHIYDMGIEGLDTTNQILSEKNIIAVGTNQNIEESNQGKIYTKNGIKLGFVSYTFGLNGNKLPTEQAYRVNVANIISNSQPAELYPIKNQIDYCRKEECDFIITSLHWGYEFEMVPRDRQIAAAHELVEYGSDAIICHHPHVIQPVEYYKTKRDPDRIAPIAYSLGSLAWGFSAPHLALSLVQNLKITKGMINDKEITYVENAQITPIFRNVLQNGEDILSRIELLDDFDGTTLYNHEHINQMKKYFSYIIGC